MGYVSASVGVFRQPRPRVVGRWMGLALSYHLLCRASEIWAYGNGLVHPDFCLTRIDVFFRGTTRLAWKDRRRADKVKVTFRAGKSDQIRLGSVVPRTRVAAADGVEGDVRSKGALGDLARFAGSLPHLGRGGTTHADVLCSGMADN